MNKTEKLKHIILSKYNSVREFSKIVEIPSTTLTSALDKGIGGMAVDRIIKICDVLNIDIKTFEPLEDITQASNLSQEETTLLENFNKLNDLGKKEANKRVSELSYMPMYCDNEISATTMVAETQEKYNAKDNVIELNTKKQDDEEIFAPYKSFEELGAKCNAAHADDLTLEELERVKQIILDSENEIKLQEWNKKHNK